MRKNEFVPIIALGLILAGLIAAGDQAWPAPLPALRLLLGLLFVLLIPGYTLQAALFPRRDDLDGLERLALSFGLSIAVLSPLALALDRLPWGLSLWPVVAAQGLFIAAGSLVAWQRRQRLPEREQFAPLAAVDAQSWWAAQGRTQRSLYVILAGALLAATLLTCISVSLPKPGEAHTAFYALGPQGIAENYPWQVTRGEPVTVTLGIANQESGPEVYRVEIRNNVHLVGQAGPIHLPAGATDEREVTFTPVEAGQEVQLTLLLYRDGQADAYRSLRLWLHVWEGKQP